MPTEIFKLKIHWETHTHTHTQNSISIFSKQNAIIFSYTQKRRRIDRSTLTPISDFLNQRFLLSSQNYWKNHFILKQFQSNKENVPSHLPINRQQSDSLYSPPFCSEEELCFKRDLFLLRYLIPPKKKLLMLLGQITTEATYNLHYSSKNEITCVPNCFLFRSKSLDLEKWLTNTTESQITTPPVKWTEIPSS